MLSDIVYEGKSLTILRYLDTSNISVGKNYDIYVQIKTWFLRHLNVALIIQDLCH